MAIVLYLLVFLGITINLSVPASLSNKSNYALLIEGLFVCVISKVIIEFFLKNCNSKDKNEAQHFFLFSLFLSLVLLNLFWTPYLLPSSEKWGFDPQRYYHYAIEFNKYGYYDGWVGSGFNGIVFFYAFIFNIVGYHPLIPLYLNMLLVLLSTLMLYDVFKNTQHLKLRYLLFLLFIPELLYYNMMPAKDNLCQFGMVFIFYGFYKFQSEKKLLHFVFFVFSIALEMLIRFPYALACLLAIGGYILFFSKRVGRSSKYLLLILLVVVSVWGIRFVTSLSSVDGLQEDFAGRIGSTMTGGVEEMEGGSAIAAMLTPHSMIEVFVFGVIRSFLYLFPEGSVSLEWRALGALSQPITGIIAAIFIGVFFSFVSKSFREKDNKNMLLLLFFLSIFFLIGFSTPNFIHQRYRISYDMFYFLILILAYCRYGKKKIIYITKRWLVYLTCLSLLYIILRLTR